MWEPLWQDFRVRAERLARGAAGRDAVDQTIAWQLAGDANQCGRAIPFEDLHLPEIFSGAPWSPSRGLPGGRLQGAWIAVVCGNPSIDPAGHHPRLSQWAGIADSAAVLPYFHGRFDGGGPMMLPVPHGRDSAGRPSHWTGVPPTEVEQTTWREIELAIDMALRVVAVDDAMVSNSLGSIAAIADAVPWKFRKWNPVPDPTKRELMDAGSPYLEWFLAGRPDTSPPEICIFMGSCARRQAARLFPGAGIEHRVTRLPLQDIGRRRLRPHFEPYVIASPHPADQGGRFRIHRDHLINALVRALA